MIFSRFFGSQEEEVIEVDKSKEGEVENQDDLLCFRGEEEVEEPKTPSWHEDVENIVELEKASYHDDEHMRDYARSSGSLAVSSKYSREL